MSIKALINEDLIDLHLHGSNQLNVIEQMASMLEVQGRIDSKSIFTESVLEREAQVTTGFGNGIAIPHGKDKTVKDTSITIGRLSNPVDWKAMDDRDVSFVIMLAIPESKAGTTHLQILSQLSGKLMDEDFRDSLMKANEKEDVLNLLSDCITEKNIG